ncbi:MAG: cation:proton antiporter [Magnetovibrio sp.]|nr:cation:proton antiporter [Magnetovibrio sp.]
MDFNLISIDYRDPAWIAVAFLFGLSVRQINLPPMVGFLLAGFMLHLLGAENDQFLLAVADLGVTLLLFTIGLKLRLNTLIRPEIWATTGLHMVAIIVLTVALVLALGWAGVLLFDGLDFSSALVLAFALSFSSTVFAVKTLEDRGSLMSRYGLVAIGVLIMQDIAAVVFLAISVGKLPSLWALGLLALIPIRPLLGYLMHASGHKELLTVFGFVAALGGAALFEVVGMKGDLGALVIGILLANHEKAKPLAKILMSFKDVFLVCFFLTIGLTGLPTWETASTALILFILVPIKIVLFIYLLTRFRMRAHGATLGGLVLGNYSEFGLIVGAIAISSGWLEPEWLTVIALSLTASFVFASPINVYADAIYTRFHNRLTALERKERLPGDEDINLRGHRILVFGMGRVGRAAYDEMTSHVEHKIIGIDLDEVEVQHNIEAGRNVVLGDATNPEFWSRLITPHQEIDMILLAMPHHNANLDSALRLRERGYQGPIIATALFPYQEEELRENGIDDVFNIYAEAGSGAVTRMKLFMDEAKQEN